MYCGSPLLGQYGGIYMRYIPIWYRLLGAVIGYGVRLRTRRYRVRFPVMAFPCNPLIVGVEEDVGSARPCVKCVILTRRVEDAEGTDKGEGVEFQEARSEGERVRRDAGGGWWSESIHVAEACVRCRRPKWECCQVRTKRELWGVPGRGGVPLLERLVH
jgi:hypothetical protein